MTNGEDIEIELMNQQREAEISHNGIRTAVDDVKKQEKESTILSYKLLIVGILIGCLGNLLVSSILRFWEYTGYGLMGDILLLTVGFIGFGGCIWFVINKVAMLEENR